MHHVPACEDVHLGEGGQFSCKVAYTTRYFKHSQSVQVYVEKLEIVLWVVQDYVFLCGQDTVFEQPVRTLSEAQVEDMNLKYYNSEVHKAAFVLPQFAKKVS